MTDDPETVVPEAPQELDRWRVLSQLEARLQKPMLLLSFVWSAD